MGMAALAAPLVVKIYWEGPWKNPTESLGYCQGGETSKVANLDNLPHEDISEAEQSVQALVKSYKQEGDEVK